MMLRRAMREVGRRLRGGFNWLTRGGRGVDGELL